MRKHSKAVTSPNEADAVLVRDEETGEVKRAGGKLLRACSFRELHNDLCDDAIQTSMDGWIDDMMSGGIDGIGVAIGPTPDC